MPTTLTPTQASKHYAHAFDEAQRLKERFELRSKDEKKRLGVIQSVLPKLKLLVKGSKAAVTAEEMTVLEALPTKN